MKIQPTTNKTVQVIVKCMATVLIAAPFLSWSVPAGASEDDNAFSTQGAQTIYTADLAAMMNPDGLMLMTGGYKRWVKEAAEEGMPARYSQAGFGLGLNPAYAKGSLHAELQPAIFFKVRLAYDLYGFFGTNGGLLSFPDAEAKFGRHELHDLEGREEKALGHRGLVQPTFSAKAGPLLIINQTDMAYYRFSGDGPYFLDWEYDTLVKDGGYVIANRTQFLVPAWKGTGKAVLYVGPYYEITHAHDADLTRQRAGGQFYWIPIDSLLGMDNPRIYSQLGINIQDPNRQGEIFMNLGFGVNFNR